VRLDKAEGTLSMPFTHPIRVYWEDTDAGGIVFYANYLKFFERARTEWLRNLGVGQQALRERTGGMFVVLETTVAYQRPARLDDMVLVSAEVSQMGRASLSLQQQAWRLDRGEKALLAEGTIRIGWVDAASMRPQRIPPDILQMLMP
jgi:acyl-CoA thioester hydrolase